jgi:molecular chaperone HscC
VEILQGESRLAKDNIFLGELNIPVPPNTIGEEAVDVRFTYNLNGILEVEVTVVSTGMKKSMVIEKDPGHMTKEEIMESIENLSSLKVHPRETHENRLVIARGERLYEEKTGMLRQEIANLLMEFEECWTNKYQSN